MIRQELYIRKYDWSLHIYYAVTRYRVGEIMERLYDIGCNEEFAGRAYKNMVSGKLNHGLTYSNYGKRETVMVVGLASSAAEYADSIVHELFHLTEHIAEASGIVFSGERPAYLIGDVMRSMHGVAGRFICGCH